MSRCAYLSSGGDVFLSEMVLNFWNERWRNEIDVMYVGFNNHAEVPLETAYEFLRKWEKDPKVRIIYTPHGVGNGTPITQMLLNSKEDHLLLLEDDSFMFTPKVVDGWFSVLESGRFDIIGSPRYASGKVAEAAKRKYNLDYSGVGDKGFGWWPSFFFCKRSDLLKTDLDFGSKEYPANTYIKEIDHTMTTTEYTDTFTWTSLQLRCMGLKSYDIPQNHSHPYDMENKRDETMMFAKGNPEYIHGGSLSSGWGGYLNKKTPPVATEMEKMDIETRVAFWTIAKEMTIPTEYGGFRNDYHEGIRNLIKNADLNKDRITDKYNLYRSIMKI